MEIRQKDFKDLKKAKMLLENPGFAVRIANLIGKPIERGFELLPDSWSTTIFEITRSALTKAADAAVFTMKDNFGDEASNLWHKLAVAATGGIGGFFGLAALSIELPVSTTIMLRSIADIARSEGENIFSIEFKMACLEVFALGGPGSNDDAAESGYFAVRAALAQSVSKAAEYIAEKGFIEEGAPSLVRLILLISERFSIQVSEKTAAQAVPVIGAVGGALINTLFIDHFQDMGRGHFIIRRLERKYGAEIIERVYREI